MFLSFFLAPFSAASLSQLRGARGTRALQTVFSEASFLTCTLFLRRAASSRAHDGYRAGSRDAPEEDGHAARRSLKSGQSPSRLLRPGEGKEVRLSAKASEAAAHNKPASSPPTWYRPLPALHSKGGGPVGDNLKAPVIEAGVS